MQPLLPAACLGVAAALLTACASPMGPQATGPSTEEAPSSAPVDFQARDFAWSASPGDSSIVGTFAYRNGPVRYGCQGGDVILTPETAWSRRRMIILYGSASAAAVPVSIVRARTPSAPSGDYARFVRKTTCDGANHFRFEDLPDGAWFVITVGRPLDGGEAIAVTRRVETSGGQRAVTLY